MNKATKGALAAAAAGSLLLGGAGSLAYWTDTGSVEGATISSGHLKLSDGDCDGWSLDGGTTTIDLLTARIVPGDELTNVCTLSVDMVGDTLSAKFDVSVPHVSGTGALASALDPSATYKVAAAGATTDWSTVDDVTLPAAIHPDDAVQATITVLFPDSGDDTDNVTNDAAGLQATLDNITITATQDH